MQKRQLIQQVCILRYSMGRLGYKAQPTLDMVEGLITIKDDYQVLYADWAENLFYPSP